MSERVSDLTCVRVCGVWGIACRGVEPSATTKQATITADGVAWSRIDKAHLVAGIKAELVQPGDVQARQRVAISVVILDAVYK